MNIELHSNDVYHIIRALAERRRMLLGDYEAVKKRGMHNSMGELQAVISEIEELIKRVETNFYAEKAAK